jgi:signal peptidase I
MNDRRMRRTKDGGFLIEFTGMSMKPTLLPGDVLHVRPYLDGSPAPGDIVVVENPDAGLIAHRVYARAPNGYALKGDNNRIPDSEPALEGEILGRVVWVIRGKTGFSPWSGKLGIVVSVSRRLRRALLDIALGIAGRLTGHRTGKPR